MSYIQELYTEFRGFPRTIKLFYVTDVFYGFSQAIFGTLFNLHLLAVGFTANHIGQLQLVASLLLAALAIPVGLAADRFGRRWFYVTGSLLFGLPYLVMPWFTNWAVLMAGYVVLTVGNTLMMVNESPLLAGEVGSDRRASVFSFMMINFFIWNTLGIQIAGFLVDWLPVGPLSKYQWPLMFAGISGLMSGLGRGFLPFRKHGAGPHRLSLRPTRTTINLGLANLLAGGFVTLFWTFQNVILAQRFHFESEAISTILTVSGVLGWLAALAVPWTSRRTGELKAYVLILGLQGVLTVVMGFAGMPYLFLTVFWARNMLGNMQTSVFNAFAMEVTPDAERATANSYAMLGRNLGNAAMSKVFGAALTAGQYLFSFTLAGALAMAGAAYTAAVFRRQARFGTDSAGAN